MTTTSLGHIYKIICKVDEKFCYIGSTFDRLSKRMERHRNHYNDWVNGKNKKPCSCYPYFQKYGIENFKIVLIKSYEVIRTHNKDTKHLRAYETLWMNKTKCVNKNSPIGYLRLERHQEYREKNKDKIKIKNQDYYKNNKVEIKSKQREHYEKNKDEIKIKTAKKVECKFCKSLSTYGHLPRHQKTKKCLKAQGK